MHIKGRGCTNIEAKGIYADAVNITLFYKETGGLWAETGVVLDTIGIRIPEGFGFIPFGVPAGIEEHHCASRDFTIGTFPCLNVGNIECGVGDFGGFGGDVYYNGGANQIDCIIVVYGCAIGDKMGGNVHMRSSVFTKVPFLNVETILFDGDKCFACGAFAKQIGGDVDRKHMAEVNDFGGFLGTGDCHSI